MDESAFHDVDIASPDVGNALEILPVSPGAPCSATGEKPRKKRCSLKRELASLVHGSLIDIDNKQRLERTKRTRSQPQFYGRVASKVSQEGKEKMVHGKVFLEEKEISGEETLAMMKMKGQEGREKTVDDKVCLSPSTEKKEISGEETLATMKMKGPEGREKSVHDDKVCITLSTDKKEISKEETPNTKGQEGREERVHDDKVCLMPSTEKKEISTEEAPDTMKTKASLSSSSQDCDKVDNFERANHNENDSRATLIGQDIARTLKAINRNYGDITRDCSLQSPHMKVYVLLGICDLVQDLRNKQLQEIHIDDLDNYYQIVADAEGMKVNVVWLRTRLDEIKVAMESIQEMEALKNERNTRLQDINNRENELLARKVELERLKSEVKDCEEQLSKEVRFVEVLDRKISALTSKSSEFPHKFLMDGLL